MKFTTPLIPGTLIKRYKRFLADVRLDNGEEITVHCPNPGAMLGLNQPGNPVWISDSNNPKRKLRYTLELMEVEAPTGRVLVGINTMWPNKLAEQAILRGTIPELMGYSTLRREVKYGENSRIDILLEQESKPPCYVEVKNVHFLRQPGLHEFPDCKTVRGATHLKELANVAKAGGRAVMLYVIQREDGDNFALASDIDPDYADAMNHAIRAGVEILAIRCKITTTEIIACDPIATCAFQTKAEKVPLN